MDHEGSLSRSESVSRHLRRRACPSVARHGATSIHTLLEYKSDLYGTHVKEVEARGTTKECASCGVETAKPIWVREHSCPSCGFETARDGNAAMKVLQRGFSELGLGCPEDTPVETVTATDTTHFESVSASHVVETGSLGA